MTSCYHADASDPWMAFKVLIVLLFELLSGQQYVVVIIATSDRFPIPDRLQWWHLGNQKFAKVEQKESGKLLFHLHILRGRTLVFAPLSVFGRGLVKRTFDGASLEISLFPLGVANATAQMSGHPHTTLTFIVLLMSAYILWMNCPAHSTFLKVVST